MVLMMEWRFGVEISELKNKFSLPSVLTELGYPQELVRQSTNCPFHEDKNPSFGIWKDDAGQWKWKCHAGCGGGDAIDFIQVALNLSQSEAIHRFKQMAGATEARPVLVDPPKRIDWTEARDAFKPAHRNKLAKWRGLTSEFVDWLHTENLLGVVQGQLAFPVQHNPRTTSNGSADGAHLFSRSKGWRILGGKSSPWWIGDNEEHVFVFESQWDAFAFMDKSLWHQSLASASSILITRGAQAAKKISGLIPQKSKVYLFTQNDEAAGKWQDDITQMHPRCHIVSTPEEYKDLNDWVKAGATGKEIIGAVEGATLYENPDAPRLPGAMDWTQLLAFDPRADMDNMLGSRWLSKSGSCVWVGSSGLGKSVLTLQAAMTWATGMPFMGIHPKGQYKSLIIQAENNFGDVAETIQGVKQGLAKEYPELSFDEIQQKVSIVRMVNSSGLEFIARLKGMIAEYQPDMVWIDPLLCYLGGDPNSSEDVSYFTGLIDELAIESGCLFHIIHHTGKPKTSADTRGFTTADLMYAGLGSSVLTNWARAIMVLQGERGSEGIFRLTAAKRGKRSGLSHEWSTSDEYVHLEHSTEGLCWLPSEYEPPEKGSVGRPSFRNNMLSQWPASGFTQKEAMDHFADVHFDEIDGKPTAGSVKNAIAHYTRDGSLTRVDGRIIKQYGGGSK